MIFVPADCHMVRLNMGRYPVLLPRAVTPGGCQGWTMTTAEILNNADREEIQVQMEAQRQKVQLRQRKMSAALKASI